MDRGGKGKESMDCMAEGRWVFGITGDWSICMYVCMVITCSRVWINRVRLPILLVVS